MVVLTAGMRRTIVSAVHATTVGDNNGTTSPTTELDSHANMVVLGEQATVISRSNTVAEVSAFAEDCNKLSEGPIVDAAIAYDCPLSLKTYLLIVRNALHVPSMRHNLIPPFIMREAGHKVNDVPRIHCGQDVTEDSHSIIMDGEVDLKIPLRIRGIFSYFPTRALTQGEIEECDGMDAICLTPDAKSWDPSDGSWAEEEDKYLTYQGEFTQPRPTKRRRLLDEVGSEVGSMDGAWVHLNTSSAQWESVIDATVNSNDMMLPPDTSSNLMVNLDQDDPIRSQV